MGFGASQTPKAAPLPPPTPEPARAQNNDARVASDAARRRIAAGGRTSTILTGNTGLDTTPATTAKKVLLGQ